MKIRNGKESVGLTWRFDYRICLRPVIRHALNLLELGFIIGFEFFRRHWNKCKVSLNLEHTKTKAIATMKMKLTFTQLILQAVIPVP